MDSELHVGTHRAYHCIAKALELFLAMIVDEASKVTIERGSKRVEAYHLCVTSSLARITSR